MTGASEDLLQAVYGLRKAAEAQFTGNTYYQVANEINALIEFLGWGEGKIAPGDSAAYGFATMLGEVRKIAEASTSGNQYYMIAHKLDQLAAYLRPAAPAAAYAAPAAAAESEKPAPAAPAAAPVETPAPPPAAAPEPAPSAAPPSFLDLCAASTARVEEMAGSLDVTPAHAAAAPLEAEASAELEKRSSEPMAEVAPVDAEPVAAAPVAAVEAAVPEAPAEHVHTGGGDAAKCPFHALVTDTAAILAGPGVAQDGPALAAREKIESFDELAAASNARVEQVAADLGIVAAHAAVHAGAAEAPAAEALAAEAPAAEALAAEAPAAETLAAEAPAAETLAAEAPAAEALAAEIPGERRLESRCSESAGQTLETVESAIAPRQTAPELLAAEAAPDLGSPAAQGETLAVEEVIAVKSEGKVAVEAAAAETMVAPAAAAPAPVLEKAAAADRKIGVIQPAQAKRKTLFKLWLDLAFGRKD